METGVNIESKNKAGRFVGPYFMEVTNLCGGVTLFNRSSGVVECNLKRGKGFGFPALKRGL